MASAIDPFDDLDARIARRERSSLVRTIVASLVVIAVAAAFLWFTLRELNEASARLSDVKAQLDAVQQDLVAAQSQRDTAVAEAKAAAAAQDAAIEARNKAETAARELEGQVGKLQQQVADLEIALKESLNLEKHIYKLDFYDLKSIYAVDARAADLLSAIANLRSDVRWGIKNTQEEGTYNSPGFADLVLRQFGSQLSGLKRDKGPPRPGDIVTYASGYHLFYFRDIDGKEFVVGMTPFGVLALNYDFGVKRGDVLRTGFSQQ